MSKCHIVGNHISWLICSLHRLFQCEIVSTSYTAPQMAKAYKAVTHQNMSVPEASKVYGVPKSTLGERFKGRFAEMAFKPSLNEKEEKAMVDHLKYNGALGYQYTAEKVTSIATDYCIALGKKTLTDPEFGGYWYFRFRKRWPDWKASMSEKLDEVRRKATASHMVDAYYDEYKTILDGCELSEHPDNIYVLEEIRLKIDNGNEDASSAEKEANVTLIGCGNASGGLVPPYFVLPGKEWNDDYLEGTCNGAGGECTESGSCNYKVIKNYFENHLKKFVRVGMKNRPTLILYDGHNTTLPLVMGSWAEKNNVLFFALPPYLSSVCQFNIGCFAAVHDGYTQECNNLHQSHILVNKANVGKIANKCYLKAMVPEALSSEFSRTGLYPYARTVIEYPISDSSTAHKAAIKSTEEQFEELFKSMC